MSGGDSYAARLLTDATLYRGNAKRMNLHDLLYIN
jgi:hypothetical protein